jgi:Protein of unknown function (DUF3800)
MRLTLPSYLDESSDERRKDVLCVGAILVNEQHLKVMEGRWLDRLKNPDDIEYFRLSACKGVHEPFFKLREKYGDDAQAVADSIRRDLEAILLSSPWVGFGAGILIEDYAKVRNEVPAARYLYSEDPTEAAFSQMFGEVGWAAKRCAPECEVAFIIDESTYSGKIAEAFKATKMTNPEIADYAVTCAPKDDKKTPPLQMADLIAGIIKDVMLEWLSMGKPLYVPLEDKWHNHFEVIGKWDEGHMRTAIKKTLSDPRFIAGELPARPLELTARDLKRVEKKRRKALIQARQEKDEH